jgi:O-antigen/teichoic acid export membrane protein
MDLQKTLFKGFAWSSAANIAQRALAFLILLVLVRLLSKQDFGTAATGSMIVSLLQPVTRFGTFDYLVQKPDVDERVQTGAFFTSLVFGVISSLGLFALAGPIAAAFHDPNLKPVVQLLSPVFLLKSVSCVHEAMLTKAFGFKMLAMRTVGGVFLAGGVAIAMALCGYGLFALVAQQLVAAATSSAILCLSYKWKLDRHRMLDNVRAQLPIGARYTVAQLLSSANNSAYGLVIGLFLSTQAAGVFRLAWSALDLCVQLTIRPFTQVAQPIFAKARAEQAELGEAYLRVTELSAAFTFLVFGLIGAMGPEIGLLLYGQRFHEAGPALSIICCVVVFATPNYMIASLLNSIGRANQLILLSLAQCAAAVVLAAISAPLGMTAVAIAFILRVTLTSPIAFILLKRATDVRLLAVCKVLAAPLASALTMVAVLWGLKLVMPAQLPAVVKVVVAGLLGTAVYAGGLTLLNRRLVLELLDLARPLLNRFKPKA